MPFLTVDQKKATDFLTEYQAVLTQLETNVDAAEDTTILHRQLISSTHRALLSISNHTSFHPTLVASAEDSDFFKNAFMVGAFGDPPNAHQCLKTIFSSEEAEFAYRSTFKMLGERFLEGAALEKFNQFYEAIVTKTISPHLLKKVSDTVTKDALKSYLSALQVLLHYAPSPAVEKMMQEDAQAFGALANVLLGCIETLNNMFEHGTMNPEKAKIQIKQFGRKLDDLLIYLDKTDLYPLEGKGQSKEEQRLSKKSLWELMCYHLAQFFRLIFMILSVGFFKHENPLAKLLGHGTFFIYKPKTSIEEKDIDLQKNTIRQLFDKLAATKKDLNDLLEAVDNLGQTHGPHLTS